MGMYDNVNFEFKCPICGKKVDDFQTKDKDCVMTTFEFYQVDNFYESCNNCGTWIEFNIKEEARKKLTINDYEITVSTNHTKEEYIKNNNKRNYYKLRTEAESDRKRGQRIWYEPGKGYYITTPKKKPFWNI